MASREFYAALEAMHGCCPQATAAIRSAAKFLKRHVAD